MKVSRRKTDLVAQFLSNCYSISEYTKDGLSRFDNIFYMCSSMLTAVGFKISVDTDNERVIVNDTSTAYIRDMDYNDGNKVLTLADIVELSNTEGDFRNIATIALMSLLKAFNTRDVDYNIDYSGYDMMKNNGVIKMNVGLAYSTRIVY